MHFHLGNGKPMANPYDLKYLKMPLQLSKDLGCAQVSSFISSTSLENSVNLCPPLT